MTPILKKAPFLKLLPVFIGGILLAQYGVLPVRVWGILCLVAIVLLVCADRLSMWQRFRGVGWRTGGLLLLTLCCGGILLFYADPRREVDFYGKALSDSSRLVVCIAATPEVRERTCKMVAEVTGIVRGTSVTAVRGKLLLYIAVDSNARRLRYGDRLLVGSSVRVIVGSGHPGGFDYARYCARQGIYYQSYVRGWEWCVLPGGSQGYLQRVLARGRGYCIEMLRRYVGAGPAAGLAAALLIGYRYDLDAEMVKTYVHTGIMHIIAISGMHLALLFGTLLWLLRWWPVHVGDRWCKVLLVFCFLWGFTLLTGAAASVLRAAVMFSFIAIGTFLTGRQGDHYNTLAASAFLLLCYDPYLLWDVGFQLSYLAVLSILLFYKPIYQLLDISARWVDWIWDAIALTLAAQVFTIPVCLYYFHQFPHLFLPANLIAVPMSTLILYGEVLLMCLSGWSWAAEWVGAGIRLLITTLNGLIYQLDRLPWALTEHIYFPWYALVCMYLFLVVLALWWLACWRKGVLAALGLLLIWLMAGWYDDYRVRERRRMVVYNIPGYTAIDLVSGGLVWYAGDSALLGQAALLERHIVPTRLYWQLPVLFSAGRWKGDLGRGITFGSKRLVVVRGGLPEGQSRRKLRTDYILLSHNPDVDIRRLLEFYVFDTVIFDASNPAWKIRQWKNDCYALTLRCFSVPDQGAFVVNF